MAITIKCTNYECKFRNDNTKLCTLETVNMATDHWNRHGVCCNSCKCGDKVKKSYYTPEWLQTLKGQKQWDKAIEKLKKKHGRFPTREEIEEEVCYVRKDR